MPSLSINGVDVEVEKGSMVLEAIRFLGFNVPTLCHRDGLTPIGACRLCVVEISEGENTKLVSSCTYPAIDGLKVKTHTERVIKARKMLVEMLLSICPESKVIQDLASRMEISKVRFKPRFENCILCGLCVRICEEQMDAKAIGFINRGEKRSISTPFNKKSEVCRTCGACMYICPACQMRCVAKESDSVICGACMNFAPVCLDKHDNVMCYLDVCGWCLKEPEKNMKE